MTGFVCLIICQIKKGRSSLRIRERASLESDMMATKPIVETAKHPNVLVIGDGRMIANINW